MPTDSDLYSPPGGLTGLIGGAAAITKTASPTAPPAHSAPRPPAATTPAPPKPAAPARPAAAAPAAAAPAAAPAAAAAAIDVTGVQAWADALYEHYLGRPATQADLEIIASQGWSPDQLKQHLRSQPSYIPGLSIGGYEDLYNVSRTSYLKYLGHEPGDQDIRELVQKGIADQFSLDSYLKNRPDVVALHPGAPIDLTDEEYGAVQGPVQAHYQANLQRDASADEVRQAYLTRNTPAPQAPVALEPQFQLDTETKALKAPNLISPTARGFA